MQATTFISERDLRRREGVRLLGTAGIDSPWSMPVAIWDAPNGFDTRDRPDEQPCHVIAVRLSGGGVRRIGSTPSRQERLPADGFSVHPACTELRFVAPAGIRFAHIYVSEAFFRRVSDCLCVAEGHSTRFVSDERVMYQDTDLGKLLDDYVRRAFDTLDPPISLEMESRANMIAIQFLKKHSPSSEADLRAGGAGQLATWQLKRACRFMEENLARDVSLADVAGLLGISPEHFCRAFHRSVGLPPHRWILARRMGRARERLLQSDASLTAIAQELGYASQSAFGAAFRRATGISPSAFRRAAF